MQLDQILKFLHQFKWILKVKQKKLVFRNLNAKSPSRIEEVRSHTVNLSHIGFKKWEWLASNWVAQSNCAKFAWHLKTIWTIRVDSFCVEFLIEKALHSKQVGSVQYLKGLALHYWKSFKAESRHLKLWL